MSEAIFVFIVIILIFAIIPACIRHYRHRRREEQAASSELPQFRQERQEQRRSQRRQQQQQSNVTTTDAAAAAAAAAGTMPMPSAPPSEEAAGNNSRQRRKELIMKHLYHRTLEHGDSVRTLSMLLAVAKDHYDENDNASERDNTTMRPPSTSSNRGENKLVRSWRSAETSVRTFVSANKPECSICLDAYEAKETVSWAKNDDCDHIFHQDCIVMWLMNDHDECPLCRTNLLHYDHDHNEVDV